MDERIDDVAAGGGRVLRVAAHAGGPGPLSWAAAPLTPCERVLDLCCGDGLLAGELLPGRWVGVDPRPLRAGPTPRLRAEPGALPLRDNAVDGLAVILALPRLPDLDSVFAEVRRVLRPGGTLVVVVPSATARSTAELRFASVLGPVHRAWQHRSALDQAGWLLSAADFAVMGDDRRTFTVPLPDAATALALVDQLPAAGLWPPDLASDVRSGVAAELARRARPGRLLPLPMRRLVARR